MNDPDPRPWLAHYPEGIPPELPDPAGTALDVFRAAVATDGGAPCIHYLGHTLSYADVDAASDRLAAALVAGGSAPGDRVALYLQNDPEFMVAMLATWKAGGVLVPINPMLRAREIEHILGNSGARVLISLADLYRDVAAEVVPASAVERVIVTVPGDSVAGFATEPAPAVDGVERLGDLLAADPAPLPDRPLSPADIAYLVYTSGTTGKPKAAVNTHANVVYNSEVMTRWIGIDATDCTIAAAPLFHMTGLVPIMATSHRAGCPIVLFHRFDAGECLRLIEEHRCTYTVMAITAYLALMDHPDFETRDLTHFTKAYSGGSPVAEATAKAWERVTGSPIYNIYGLTETTAPSHLTPLGRPGPIDPETGALAVGLPVPGAMVRVVDAETGADVPVGELGEIWTKGPMVIPEYWQNPAATEASLVDGYLRTGDIGKMDGDGWFWVIDRIKDMINASGFKVWPSEVEDFLYEHPAVREAAVVGVPDPYRGETVKAFLSLRTGARVTSDEVIAYCREGLAAYKCPRIVDILDDLPKTASGKILRRELRDHP